MNKKCKDFYRCLYILKISTVVFLCIITILLLCFSPLTVHADRAKGDAYFQVKIRYTSDKTVVNRVDSVSLKGDGHFNVRTAKVSLSSTPGYYEIYSYIFSDMPFEISGISYVQENTTKSDTEVYTGSIPSPEVKEKSFNNGLICYFAEISHGLWGSLNCNDFSLSVPNIMDFIDECDINDIVRGIDLTKDDWQTDEQNEKSAAYNKDLDLTSFGAHAYQKWSVKRKTDNSGWDFITDEEAGVRYNWTYNTDIKDSYIKFTYYGNYYEKMFNPSYNDGVLSISGDGVPNVVSMRCTRSLKEKMFYTKADLFNALYAKYGYSKIYAFETKYVYAQCFGYVDGEFCRSRTYRINYDMVMEDGDTWILEPVGTDPLPEEYVPDDSDPDPKPSDPDPDPGDWKDTTPNPLPPNPADPDFPTDNSILNALKWFYETLNGLKDSLGAFPALVNSVFGFLPQPVILLLGASIVLVVIMRFAGR